MSREPTPPPGSPPDLPDEQAIRTAVAGLAKQLGPGSTAPVADAGGSPQAPAGATHPGGPSGEQTTASISGAPRTAGGATEETARRSSITGSAATVRRVTIRRPVGEGAPPTDDEDVWVVPGSPAATEAAAKVTTRTGAPVRATSLAASAEAARRFRPSRWLPGVVAVLVLGIGAVLWSGILPWQRGVDVNVPTADAGRAAKGVGGGSTAPGSAPAPAVTATAPAAEPKRPSADSPTSGRGPADPPPPSSQGATPPVTDTGPSGAASKPPDATAPAAAPGTAPSGPPSSAASPPSGPAVAAAPSPSTPSAPAPTAPASIAPSFDIARVSPDGRAVIAGRATPGSRITVVDGTRDVITVETNARGEWVAVIDNPPLPPGAHDLQLVQRVDGRDVARGERTITVMVPTPPAVAAVPPGATPSSPVTPPAGPPSTSSPAPAPGGSAPLVVSTPGAGGPSTVIQAPGGPDTLARAGSLVLGAVDYDEQGRLTITGRAPPGTIVRIYVDNKLAGEATAGADGAWVVRPAEAVATGRRVVRVDQVTAAGGVTSRLEVPFERLTLARPGVVTIVRGDNLWNIARSRYGDGLRYTVIYEANKNQIRDPDLIYPGQIFVVPKSP